MKKVTMMMRKNEEKKRRIVFVSSSSSSSSYLYQLIDIELKRLTLVCANFKRKTFAFSRRRATLLLAFAASSIERRTGTPLSRLRLMECRNERREN